MIKQIIILGLSLVVFSGCAPKMYHWGAYEDDLYRYYKSPKAPEDHEAYMLQLSNLIEDAKKSGDRIPPGIYAEYGYALFKTGKYQEAIEYFDKEKSLWPESKPLMERLVANVRIIMDQKTPLTEK